MGCDIHMWAEVKHQYPNKEIKPEWVAVGKVFKNDFYDKRKTPTISFYKGEEPYWNNEIFTEEPYQGRNYSLFAILADVRNGYGFAGVDTGDGFKPISSPKGVPKDATKYYKHQVKGYGTDGHSHSYLTIKELKEYDWYGQKTTRRGMVSLKEYKHWLKEKGRPREWCGGTSDPNYKKITWEETYYECTKDFVDKTIPSLERLLKDKSNLDVRIVFFFDN